MTDVELLSASPRVLLGDGAVAMLPAEVDRVGCRRALVFATPRRRAEASDLVRALGSRGAGVFVDTEPHVPRSVVDAALARAIACNADILVAYGGGTALGAAKAAAALSDMPIIAIPTTYSGSEMTDIYGITEGGRKVTARRPNVRPITVLYDPSLSRSLPLMTSMTSGFNAIAHCVEALWVVPGDDRARAAGALGLRQMAEALRAIAGRPRDPTARRNALRAAFFAGEALAGGITLHHKLCHLLGGRFGMPHAETHTVLLPQVARYNEAAAPEAMRTIGDALGAPAARGLFDLATELGAPTSLGPMGFSRADVPVAAAEAAHIDASMNPRPVDESALVDLIDRAQRGVRP